MSDEAITDTSAPPPAAPAPQPSSPAPSAPAPAYTQAQVDAMIAEASRKAHDAAHAEARRIREGKGNGASSPAPQPASPTPAAASGLTFQDLARYDAFKTAASEHGVPARGVEMLLTEFMATKPSDPRAWVAEQAAAFGWSKATSTPPAANPAATPAPSAPSVPPTPTPSGSPPAPSSGVYDLKPSQMKPADIAAYVAKNGPKAFSALVRQELAGTRLTPPPRR